MREVFNGRLLTGRTRGERVLAVWVLAALGLLLVVRVVTAVGMELMPEEAYYWTYWQHPSLSYFDHPPMVAWVIGLGTTLFGDTELGVRAGFIALHLAAAWLLFGIARRWVGSIAAWGSVALFGVLPVFFMTGTVAFPDGPLICFWLLAMWGVTRVAVDGEDIGWLWAGIGFGGALLSKYTAVMLAPSVLMFLVLSRDHRHWLKRPHPWLAACLGLCMFTPVIFWNSRHEWASFLFQASRTDDETNRMATSLGMFWVYQLAAVTPPVLALFMRAARRWDAAGKYALCFAAPLFAVFLKASFKTDVHINWTAPAYLSMIPVAVALAGERFTQSRAWRVSGWLTAGVLVATITIGISTLLTGRPSVFASSRVGGWRQLAAEVERAEDELQRRTGLELFILGTDKYSIAAELSFYTGKTGKQVNNYALGQGGLGFRFWTNLQDLEGRPAIAVLTNLRDTMIEELRSHFQSIGEPRRVEIATVGHRKRMVYLVDCEGYRAADTKK
jgi:dolichol-phosphate mannosyltransferase